VTGESHKISFHLEQDVDGYPPVTTENLWATMTGSGLYKVDNIPFYVKGISSGDLVSAVLDDDQLRFDQLVEPSSNSVFRLYVDDVTDVQTSRDEFKALGCESELSNISKLVAFEVPGAVDFNTVATLLDEGLASGRWECEEGVLRHKMTAFGSPGASIS
jgi:hypothetical protein